MKEGVTLKREDQKKTLADQAYKQIEEAIVTLQLAPGSIVSETELVELIGIGRTPTREAIQRLARDRLIRVLPKRGLLVAPLDLMGQMKLLEVRRQVEGLIIRLATKRASDEHRRAFAQLDAEFREIAFANDGLGFVRCDRGFNELCITAAQNEYAEDAMRPLMGLSRRFWLFHHQQCGAALQCDDHRKGVFQRANDNVGNDKKRQENKKIGHEGSPREMPENNYPPRK